VNLFLDLFLFLVAPFLISLLLFKMKQYRG